MDALNYPISSLSGQGIPSPGDMTGNSHSNMPPKFWRPSSITNNQVWGTVAPLHAAPFPWWKPVWPPRRSL